MGSGSGAVRSGPVTFQGGQLLQLAVLGEAEPGRALAPLLLQQRRAAGVFDLVELRWRRRAAAGALVAALLLLLHLKHTGGSEVLVPVGPRRPGRPTSSGFSGPPSFTLLLFLEPLEDLLDS